MNDLNNTSFLKTENKEPYEWASFLRKNDTTTWFHKEADRHASSDSNFLFTEELQIKYLENKEIHQGNLILASPRYHGIHRVFTVLKPTNIKAWYYGRVPMFQNSELEHRLILLRFCSDGQGFRLYLFDSENPTGPGLMARIIVKVLEMLKSRTTTVSKPKENGP
tara:strand:+ start:6248 stop:6742 length:495 start_codon:yes stop_codon:yes gene_type:complete